MDSIELSNYIKSHKFVCSKYHIELAKFILEYNSEINIFSGNLFDNLEISKIIVNYLQNLSLNNLLNIKNINDECHILEINDNKPFIFSMIAKESVKDYYKDIILRLVSDDKWNYGLINVDNFINLYNYIKLNVWICIFGSVGKISLYLDKSKYL